MPRLPATVLACLALAAGSAAVAGCGSDESDTASTPAESTADVAPEATAQEPKNVEVSMKDIEFVPENVTAKAGQTIIWTNAEAIPHNVTATEGAKFKSKDLSRKQTFEYKTEKAGRIDYVCTIHTGQNGSITVTK